MAYEMPGDSPSFSDRSVAVALVTLARFLTEKHPGFPSYLAGSLDHARDAGLCESDLAALRLIGNAVRAR